MHLRKEEEQCKSVIMKQSMANRGREGCRRKIRGMGQGNRGRG